jgi:PST family polysaccharide transporter
VLTRELRQDKRTFADLTGFAVGTVITLVMAVMGYGAWALAWGRFVGNAVVSLMHVMLTPQNFRPRWDTGVAKELLRSGLPLGGATLVAVALLNVDYMLVGRLLGTEQLGYYTLAFNLASWPVTFFAVAVARVSVPAFARLQHDRPALQRAYDRSSLVLLGVTLPTCLLLAVFADPLVRFVYGDKWTPAVAVLRLLAGLGLLRVLYQYWADVLVAVGAGRRTLVSQVCWLLALVPALVLGVQWGLTGVGVAHLVVALAVVGPVYVACMHGVVSLKENLRSWLHLVAATGLAAAVGAGVLAVGLSDPWTLAVGTVATMGTFGLVVWPLALQLGFQRQWVTSAARRLARRPAAPEGGPVA